MLDGEFLNNYEAVKEIAFEFDGSDEQYMLFLIPILLRTTNHKVKHFIALELADNSPENDERAINALIEVIKRPENYNYNGTQVYACTYFDCTKHIDFFCEVVLYDTFEASLTALDVIDEMKGPFQKEKIGALIKKVTEATPQDEAHEKLACMLEEKLFEILESKTE